MTPENAETLAKLIRPLDIIACHASSIFGEKIEFFEGDPNEKEPVFATHIAGVTAGDIAGTMNVTEALWTVTQTELVKWLKETQHNIIVFRYKKFDGPEQIGKNGKAWVDIHMRILSYVGKPYGVLKLATHMLDSIIHKVTGRDVHFFRRLTQSERYPICSWVWAFGYNKTFPTTFPMPGYADPDDMCDEMMNSGEWRIVGGAQCQQ